MFAPVGSREALFALIAFNHEVARIPEAVSEPMLGRIRLQWWREVVEAVYAGAPARRHEVAVPLADAIRACSLDRALLDRLLDARESDLEAEGPPDLAALERYAAATGGLADGAYAAGLRCRLQARRLRRGGRWAPPGL